MSGATNTAVLAEVASADSDMSKTTFLLVELVLLVVFLSYLDKAQPCHLSASILGLSLHCKVLAIWLQG